MESFFSSTSYRVGGHGHSDRAMLACSMNAKLIFKLSYFIGEAVGITGTSAGGGMGFHIAGVAIRKKAKVTHMLKQRLGFFQEGSQGAGGPNQFTENCSACAM